LVARVHVTSDKMLHGFGSFPGSPWSLSTSKSTGPEPMPLSNQICSEGPRYARLIRQNPAFQFVLGGGTVSSGTDLILVLAPGSL
jgi:hypothetical protein